MDQLDVRGYTSNTQIHNLSLFWLATGTPMKSCGVKLVLWPQASSIREMMNIMVTYQYSKQFQKYDEQIMRNFRVKEGYGCENIHGKKLGQMRIGYVCQVGSTSLDDIRFKFLVSITG
jgi:hypothetical protein